MGDEGVVGEFDRRRAVSLTWKVENFSSLSQTHRCFYRSSEFHFQDRRWYLKLYPNIENESMSYVGLYLFLADSLAANQVRFSLGIQAAGGKTHVIWNDTEFSKKQYYCCGPPRGILRSELLRGTDELLPQDVLTVTATLKEGGADEEGTKEVSVQTEENVINDGQEDVHEKSGGEKVLQDIEKLWVSGENSDVVLMVKDTEFKAHRTILTARTPVLAATFQHDTTEKASGEVTIDDCEPAVFEQLLHYIYTGAPRVLNAENAAALYIVADKYLLGELKALCVQCMKEKLCLDTFCDYAELSLVYKEGELLEIAVDFLSRNTIHVMKTVEWQRFLNEHSTWANEILIRAMEMAEVRNGGKRADVVTCVMKATP